MKPQGKKKLPPDLTESIFRSFRVQAGHWKAFSRMCEDQDLFIQDAMNEMIEQWVGPERVAQIYADNRKAREAALAAEAASTPAAPAAEPPAPSEQSPTGM